MIHTRKITLKLRETDATGVLYFTELFRFAIETLEEILPLKKMVEEEVFLTPIVHAEANYTLPLRVGDEIVIEARLAKVGKTSFQMSYLFLKGEERAGDVSIVHVAISKKTGQPLPVPPSLLELLHR